MSEQLHFLHHGFNFQIHAFVLMSNHYHLLVSTPDGNLSAGMSWFGRESSRSLVKEGNRTNQTYGGRYFRSVIKTQHYYLNVYKYLYFNPVKAGASREVLEYPFSTLRGLLGFSPLLIPVVEDLTLFSDVEGTLSWLNRRPDDENWEDLRKAIRRLEFTLPKRNQLPHPLEIDTL